MVSFRKPEAPPAGEPQSDFAPLTPPQRLTLWGTMLGATVFGGCPTVEQLLDLYNDLLPLQRAFVRRVLRKLRKIS